LKILAIFYGRYFKDILELIFLFFIFYLEIYRKLETPEGEEEVLDYFRQLYTMVHHVHNGDTIVMPVVDGLTRKN
jgi:hypothetical protein